MNYEQVLILYAEIFDCHCFQGAPGFRGPAGPNGIPGEKVNTSVPECHYYKQRFLLYIIPLMERYISGGNISEQQNAKHLLRTLVTTSLLPVFCDERSHFLCQIRRIPDPTVTTRTTEKHQEV